ncbi:nitroreductase family protein [Pseudomonas sp. F1_0610]|uniref:nitroreductase family protein n=1 Tax=Pseudomonas sp. F1_0610 TaxID=3114284 RepID=UPI0039C2A724
MQAMDLLLTRTSSARLSEPAPTAEQRTLLFKAAMRAPDHGLLQPWRFISIEGEARNKLSQIFADELMQQEPGISTEKIEKTKGLLLRAPLVVAVIFTPKQDHKVTSLDQLLAAGCAAHSILQSAFAQGLGAIWRTGDMISSQAVLTALELKPEEKIVGFIYLGNNLTTPRSVPDVDLSKFLTNWR